MWIYNIISNIKGVTTIIIAHRLSTIKRCDRIYVMEKGRIIEEGNHQELLDIKKHYANLWKLNVV